MAGILLKKRRERGAKHILPLSSNEFCKEYGDLGSEPVECVDNQSLSKKTISVIQYDMPAIAFERREASANLEDMVMRETGIGICACSI